MKIGKTGSGKFRNIRSNSSELLRMVSDDDSFVTTLLDIERACGDGSVALQNLPTVLRYVVGITSDFPDKIAELVGFTDEVAVSATNLSKSLTREDEEELKKIIPLAKLKHLTSVINDTEVTKIAAVGYIMNKYGESILSALDDVRKLILAGAESGDISNELLAALSEVKFLELETNDNRPRTQGRFKRSASFTSEENQTSMKDIFLKKDSAEQDGFTIGNKFGRSGFTAREEQSSNSIFGRSRSSSYGFGGSSGLGAFSALGGSSKRSAFARSNASAPMGNPFGSLRGKRQTSGSKSGFGSSNPFAKNPFK